MAIKSSQTLVEEVLNSIKTLEPEEAKNIHEKNECNLIDLRDIRELQRDGTIENSVHIPRGMLEFWIDPDSIYFQNNKLNVDKQFILFCAGGLRSALAAKTLQDMGFENVSHIDGGFSRMSQGGFKIVEKK